MQTPIDYAVIGAGVSGLYCAWRLKQACPEKNIVVFEYSNRIGGRLLTTSLPRTDLKVELGGMRYIDREHVIFTHLVDKFNLKTREFPMGSNEDPAGKKNYVYFRGKHALIGDLSDSTKIPFNLAEPERNKSPDDLQRYVMEKVLAGAGAPKDFDGWFDIDVYGSKLWKYGFWNLLYRMLSPEGYQFLKYGSGYDTNASNGNAVVLLPTGGEYSSENKFRTLADGMDTLPKTLYHEFCRIGGKGRLNHRLQSITRRKNGTYGLRFALTKTDPSHYERTADTGKFVDYKAKHVILAMPKAALERIDWEPLNDPKVRKNLDSVLSQEAVKILLAYDHAWWKSLGLTFGRSITDLPVRQTFYFTHPEDPGTTSTKPAILMASYSDIESVPFWRGLEEDADYEGPKEGYRASRLMVEEADRQVAKVHRDFNTPLPYAAAYYDWGDVPYGGGWHCWKPGYKYTKIMRDMRHPVKGEQVYICGEAYSANQGWAEGALETAEQLLVKELGLPSLIKPEASSTRRGITPARRPYTKRGFDGKHVYDAKGRLIE
jgi:lysine 2-monooxygenase